MLPNSRKRQLEEPQVPTQAFIKRNREESIRSGAPAETLFCGFVPCRFLDCVRIHVDWKRYRICRFFNSHFGCDRPDCRYKHERPTQEQQLGPSLEAPASRVVRISPPILRPPLPSPPSPPLPSPPPVQQVDDVDTELEDDVDDTSTVPDEDTLKKIEEKEAAEVARVAAILQAEEAKKKEEAKNAEREAKEEAEKAAERQKQKERDQARGIFSYNDLFGPTVRFERN